MWHPSLSSYSGESSIDDQLIEHQHVDILHL